MAGTFCVFGVMRNVLPNIQGLFDSIRAPRSVYSPPQQDSGKNASAGKALFYNSEPQESRPARSEAGRR